MPKPEPPDSAIGLSLASTPSTTPILEVLQVSSLTRSCRSTVWRMSVNCDTRSLISAPMPHRFVAPCQVTVPFGTIWSPVPFTTWKSSVLLGDTMPPATQVLLSMVQVPSPCAWMS